VEVYEQPKGFLWTALILHTLKSGTKARCMVGDMNSSGAKNGTEFDWDVISAVSSDWSNPQDSENISFFLTIPSERPICVYKIDSAFLDTEKPCGTHDTAKGQQEQIQNRHRGRRQTV
jgi:hypothetical protein